MSLAIFEKRVSPKLSILLSKPKNGGVENYD